MNTFFGRDFQSVVKGSSAPMAETIALATRGPTPGSAAAGKPAIWFTVWVTVAELSAMFEFPRNTLP